MYRQAGDLLLVPVTRNEIGEYGYTAGLLELTSDGKKILHLSEPLDFQHKAEETVRVPPGLYQLKGDENWGGAPMMGYCHE